MGNLYDKNNYVVHIRALKQALDHGLILKKVHRVIEFNQEAWLKEYIQRQIQRVAWGARAPRIFCNHSIFLQLF